MEAKLPASARWSIYDRVSGSFTRHQDIFLSSRIQRPNEVYLGSTKLHAARIAGIMYYRVKGTNSHQ